jgi:hypothetical protein
MLAQVLATSGGGAFGPTVDAAWALAQAACFPQAFLVVRFVRGTADALSPALAARLAKLEKLLAPHFGHPVLIAETDWGTNDRRAAEIARLRGELADTQRELERLRHALAAEQQVRRRVEEAWLEGGGEQRDDTLHKEVRRLREQVQSEHHARREVERNLETLRRRERMRLLRESELPDSAVARLEAELSEAGEPEEALAPAATPRRVSYHPDFERTAQRLPPSTVTRLREQIQSLAGGRWVREAKRMEGRDGLWTVRAGIHYRALIREFEDRLEVFDLIAREELDSTLARLRS